MRSRCFLIAVAVVLGFSLVTGAGSSGTGRAKDEYYVLRKVGLSGRPTVRLFKSPILNGEYTERYFIDLSPDRTHALMRRLILSDPDHGDTTLYLADIRGNHGRAITTASDFGPWGEWSPDGKRFFYPTYDTRGGCGRFEFWSAAADGGDPRSLGSGESFAWGADHQSFAIEEACDPTDSTDRLIFTDQTGQSHVIAYGWTARSRVSPRGDRIAYETFERDSSSTLHIARTDGGGELAAIPNANSASWSPDGRKIVFIKGSPWQGAIAVADANGSHVRILVPQGHDRTGHPVDPAQEPRWSPDGRHIAYMVAFEGIGTVLPSGRGDRVVTRAHVVANFWWGPDSRHIYYDGVALL